MKSRLLFFPAVLFSLISSVASAEETATRWIMLHVQGQTGQADSHLVTLPDGRHVLIDAGQANDASGAVVAQLRRHGISHISLAVVSHFHLDHYGSLREVLDAGIGIDRVVINLPGDRRIADREMPWGCNYDHVMATLETLRERGVPFNNARAGDRLIETIGADGTTCGIDVICAYDGITTPIGATDINDTSIVMRLFHGNTRVLFTGDLNNALGTYLAASEADLAADILKVPHHGTEGCAPNAFFDRVGAKAVLIPSPTALWLSQRSARIRTYFGERSIPALVNGIHGNVSVWLSVDTFRVQAEIGGFDTTFKRAAEPSAQPQTG